MTLPAAYPIRLDEIEDEFGLPRGSTFPNAFYGLGGAPASGALSFGDFLGRSNVPTTVSAISPTSQTLTGTSGSRTFAAESVTLGGGMPTSIVWSIVSPANGTWTVDSGQGTNSAVPRVTGVADGNTATCTFRVTVTGSTGVVTTRDATLSYERDSGGGVTVTF